MSVNLKIATTLRYLVSGETYTSLHYQFRSGKASISKLVVIDKFLTGHLTCPTTPEKEPGRSWRESLD